MSDVAYFWVLRRQPDRWLVSTWNGEPFWIEKTNYSVTPDLDIDGTPILKLIGNGFIGQYFRFERIEEVVE